MQTTDARIKSAWDAVENGDLDTAQKISLNLIKTGVARDRLPLVQCWTLRSLHFATLGKKAEAATLLHRCLSMFPDHPYPQELMIALLREEVMRKHGGAETKSGGSSARGGRLVLGLGTGRSGSTSLAVLFQAQDATYCTHELPPVLPWSDGASRFEFQLRRFALQLRLTRFVADISHWWLPRLEAIAESFPDFRAIILKRDKRQTVESFLKIKGGGGKGSINHWVAHNGRFWLPNA